MSKRIFAVVSGHGFGHFVQLAEVVKALIQHDPEIEVIIRCPLSSELFYSRVPRTVIHQNQATDFGMEMDSAVDVNAKRTFERYSEYHRQWNIHVDRAIRDLELIQPDLVLSNISYLELTAARKLGIPCIGLCSLNWADIFWHYCQSEAGAEVIHQQILAAYNDADLIVRYTPSLPMAHFENTALVGPVACKGINRRAEINTIAGVRPEEKLVLVDLGGIPMELPVQDWPNVDGFRWIFPDKWNVNRMDSIELAPLQMPFIDVMCSVDAMVVKVGYGALVESACNGTPVYYLPRGDWPEERYLIPWLQEHANCIETTRDKLSAGLIHSDLEKLFSMPDQPPTVSTGAAEALDLILEYL